LFPVVRVLVFFVKKLCHLEYVDKQQDEVRCALLCLISFFCIDQICCTCTFTCNQVLVAKIIFIGSKTYYMHVFFTILTSFRGAKIARTGKCKYGK